MVNVMTALKKTWKLSNTEGMWRQLFFWYKDLGGFLLKFDIIWKFVIKGAWNYFESMSVGQYPFSFCFSQK